MEEFEKQECSITLTKGEWCEVSFDLKRVVEDRKKRLADYETLGRILEENSVVDPEYYDSVKRWKESIAAAEKIIEKIEKGR